MVDAWQAANGAESKMNSLFSGEEGMSTMSPKNNGHAMRN
jgi:hypothetical protein